MRTAEEILKDFAECDTIVDVMRLRIEAEKYFGKPPGPEVLIRFDDNVPEDKREAFAKALAERLARMTFGLANIE